MVLLRDFGLVAFLALTHSARAFYAKNGEVLNLDEKSFKKEIMMSEHAAVRIWALGFCCGLGLIRIGVLGGRVRAFLPSFPTYVMCLFLRLTNPRLS